MAAVAQRLFTVDEYHAMGEAGIFTEDDRVELMDGQILAMSPIGSPHVWCINRLMRLFAQRMYGREKQAAAIISVQNPIRLSTQTEPQPDVALLRPMTSTARLPMAEDVLLLVEVADTSLEYDLEAKVPRYAAAGIPEVWVVDLQEDAVHVFRRPGAGGYAEHRTLREGEAVVVEALPDLGSYRVEEILGE